MARDKVEGAVEDDEDGPATPVTPEPSAAPGDVSRASQIFATAEEVADEEVAEVREELSEVEQAIWGWFNDHASNSPVSRATEALNYLRLHAVPDLISRIKGV